MKVNELTEKHRVHCKTQKEFDRICNLFHEAGYKWCSGDNFNELPDNWNSNKEHTVVNMRDGTYGSIGYNISYIIISSTEFEEEKQVVQDFDAVLNFLKKNN